MKPYPIDLVSVVIPVYNEEASLPELLHRTEAARSVLDLAGYWEGITTLVDMSTKWYDAAVQVCAFDELTTGEAELAGPGFRAHAIHLFSLMSACGLLELKHESL